MAARAAPTPNEPIMGRVRAKVCIARMNPLPGGARIFSLGTRTFLKLMPTVFEQRWPILGMVRPMVTPSHSASTRKAQMPGCWDLASTVAKTDT